MSEIMSSDYRRISPVHYFGSYDANYARHRIIQRGLQELGLAVVERRDQRALPLRWIALTRELARVKRGQPVVVGESSNFLTPVLTASRLLGHPAVFDTFVSLRDTVEDRRAGRWTRPLSFGAGLIDWVNSWAAGAVIFDTGQTRDYFINQFGLPMKKSSVVYVGAETDIFVGRPLPRRSHRPLRVLFYGTFIPLHGIDVILAAASRLMKISAKIEFHLVGNGQEHPRMKALARQLQLTNLVFGPDQVGYRELPELISSADVCLGVFADRPKTKRVVPHKAFQAAACGRPLVTGDTPGIREVFSHDTAMLVPLGDPDALATALMELADDPNRCAHLGKRGAALIHDSYGPRNIARQLINALEMVTR